MWQEARYVAQLTQTFKLHPTCMLHPSRHGARGATSDAVQAIVFEELVLTSQTFARTVSKIEPAWLQDMMRPTPS